MIDKRTLEEMYLIKKMPMHKIAKELNLSIGTIHKYIHAYGIKARDWKKTFNMKGRKLSKEQCKEISKRHKGKKLSEETKMKISEAHRLKGVPGHKKIRSDGYVYVYYPDHSQSTNDGYIMEHRLVMEKILGRELKQCEIVHHINKNRKDNRPENLMIFSSIRDHRLYHHYFNKKEA